MTVRIQLYFDKLIRPIVSFLNIFVRLLGLVLKIDHSLENKKFKTIAVCKFKGIGSIIQATPMLKTLRENFPEAKIIFVTTKPNKAILGKIKYIDEVITIDDSGFFKMIIGFPIFIVRLISSRIRVYIDLEIYSNFSSLVTLMSLSKNSTGFIRGAAITGWEILPT